jgi:hypothetical protein
MGASLAGAGTVGIVATILVAVLVLVPTVVKNLPPWTDSKHGAAVGAAAVYFWCLVALGIFWVLH